MKIGALISKDVKRRLRNLALDAEARKIISIKKEMFIKKQK